jgi:septal ring factor EnvC (AmiA/AmiB activator)
MRRPSKHLTQIYHPIIPFISAVLTYCILNNRHKTNVWQLNTIIMKRGKLVILMIGIVLSGITNAYAQSKKEKIELLTRRADSLEKVLSTKNENLVQLQIKLARFEGATDAHNEVIKRLENKADSLKELLIARNTTIESQASKITQLTTDINGLQAQQKDWTSKNEALALELNSLKPKPADAGIALKEVKPADPPKADAKAANVVSDNKPNPQVKN